MHKQTLDKNLTTKSRAAEEEKQPHFNKRAFKNIL